MDREEDPTDLLQLAKRCQRIKQGLKKVDRSQLVQDRIAEQSATQRNNRNNGSTRTIVNTPASAALPANLNATTLRIAQISQPQAQLVAPPLARTTSTMTTATSSAAP